MVIVACGGTKGLVYVLQPSSAGRCLLPSFPPACSCLRSLSGSGEHWPSPAAGGGGQLCLPCSGASWTTVNVPSGMTGSQWHPGSLRPGGLLCGAWGWGGDSSVKASVGWGHPSVDLGTAPRPPRCGSSTRLTSPGSAAATAVAGLSPSAAAECGP